MAGSFESLSPAVAVNVKGASARRFRAFGDIFRGYDEQVAARFEKLAVEEDQHESMLAAPFYERFGKVIPAVGAERERTEFLPACSGKNHRSRPGGALSSWLR